MRARPALAILAATVLAATVLAAVLPAAAAAQPPAGAPPAGAPTADDAPVLPSVALPPELDRVLRDYERAWRARDAAALVALFTDDGFAMQGGRPAQRGRAGLLRHHTGSGGTLHLRALAWAADDTVGYVIGAYAMREGEPDAGKFVLPLRRQPGGRWLIAADFDNMNARPGPRPPGAP